MKTQSSQNTQQMPLQKLLTQVALSDWFISLQKQIQVLARLQLLWDQFVPSELATHFQVSAFEQAVLTVVSASAAFASRLHFYMADLVKQLQVYPEFVGLQNIRCRIQPFSEHVSHLPRAYPISPESAQIIAKVADTIQEPTLQSALLALARHAEEVSSLGAQRPALPGKEHLLD